MQPRCIECGCEFASREGDLWAFFYGSTALITGFFIFLLVFTNLAYRLDAQILAGLLNVSALIITLPSRKGMAIALDWFLESRLK
ncbi:MAG TPA: DUF983 domain-containing protein [Bacteroidota bacterium]|nr:DUF983 domain-containing protein [Bacteroidota bacterium]